MPNYLQSGYISPVQGYMEGVEFSARQRRNALAEQQAQDELAQAPTRNRLAQLEVQGAEQKLSAEKAQIAHATLQQAMASGNPRQFVLTHVPELAAQLAAQGHDLSQMDDESAAQFLDATARHVAGMAGVSPDYLSDRDKIMLQMQAQEASRRQQQDFTAQQNELNRQNQLEAARLRVSNQQAPETFSTMTPEEVRAAGLPEGTSAQRSSRGKVDVLSKRDNTGALSQKDATTAKMKLNTVALAKKQLAAIKDAFEKGREGINAFGPGQGLLPTQAGKLFDQRVNQMRSTLTALTRVPGVGAMSDYETKLDQSKFPARNNYESVTADQIQQLEDQLALIENGYRDLLGGQTPASAAPAASPQQPAPPAAIEYLKANPQFKGAFKQKYGYLPPGM